jgi:hypothetical protein
VVLCILACVAIGLGAALFFGPAGILAEPAVRLWGGGFTPSLKLGGVEGSLYSGLTLRGVEIASGDKKLLAVDGLDLQPTWQDGPWLSRVDLHGLSADVDDLSALASLFGGGEEKQSSFTMKPIDISLRDIRIKSREFFMTLNDAALTRDGKFALSVNVNGLPISVDGVVSPDGSVSLDAVIGSGRASMHGDVRSSFDGTISSVKVKELLMAVPNLNVDAYGEVEGYFRARGGTGSGELKLVGGVGKIPVNVDIPWSLRSEMLTVSDGRVASPFASAMIKASFDLSEAPTADRAFVRGEVRDASFGAMADAFPSLMPKVSGDKGMLDFWVSADATAGMAGAAKIAGKVFLRVPEMALNGSELLRGLRVIALFSPNSASKMPLVSGDISAQSASFGGYRLDGILASFRYDGAAAALGSLTAKFNDADLEASGSFSPSDMAIELDGTLSKLDPATIPALAGTVEGLLDAQVFVRGTPSDPKVSLVIAGEDTAVAGVPLRNPQIVCNYAYGKASVPDTTIALPGGFVSFGGEAVLKGEPRLNFEGTLSVDLDTLGDYLSDESDLSGAVDGRFRVQGPAAAAALAAHVHAPSVAAGGFAARDVFVDLSGTTENVNVRRVEAKIEGGTLSGGGGMTFGRRGRIKVAMKTRGINIRSLLSNMGIDGGVGGTLDGSLYLQGTPRRPELALSVTSPLSVKETLVDSLNVTASSPGRGRIDFAASAKLGDMKLALTGHTQTSRQAMTYAAETDMLDVDRLISARAPSMKGQFSGSVKAEVFGRVPREPRPRRAPRAGSDERRMRRRVRTVAVATEPVPQDRLDLLVNALPSGDAAIHVIVTAPVLSAYGASLENVALPIVVSGDRATVDGGTGTLFGGTLSLNAAVSMPDTAWKADAKLRDLDLAKASAPFLGGIEVTGSADADVNMKGNYGALMMTFASGTFKSSSGYLHKVAALSSLVPKGQVPFSEARGSFFWDGSELWLNPGTQVTAPKGGPLYKYLSVQGPMGLAGKNKLGLDFAGNFDVEVLSKLLNAVKGLFQLVTGTLSEGSGFARAAVSRLIGLEDHDFEDVSFQLRGGWSDLQLLNLKIDKPLADFLPAKLLTVEDEQEKKESDKKIQFNLKIPVGFGSTDDDAKDQFKRQFLDNLLNQVAF